MLGAVFRPVGLAAGKAFPMTTGEILKYKANLCDQYVGLAASYTEECNIPGLQALVQGLAKEAFSDGFDAGVMFAEGKSVTFKKIQNDTDTGKTQTDPAPGS